MLRRAGVAAAALGLAAVSLQGCGSGGSDPAKATNTTTTTLMTTTTPTTKPPGPVGPMSPQPFVPVRGISYQAKPFKTPPIVVPGLDMMQEGYKAQFHTERDDLGMARTMGASSVRVYAGIGSELYSDHSAFLDRAEELGLNVVVDFYTPGLCEEFDCFSQWKKVALNALNHQGFKKDGKWHPAIKMIMLMNEPDNLSFTTSTGDQPVCPLIDTKAEPWCRVKAVLSAFDGLLAAEKEAGIDGKNVFVGVAWSVEARASIDGQETSELYGFADMVAGIADPTLAKYAAFQSAGYQDAYSSRWVHAINTAAPWSYTKEKIFDKFTKFSAQKLLISQMTPADDQVLADDLKAIDAEAQKGGFFIGTIVKGFQTDYDDAAHFTFLFSLGDAKLGSDMTICNEDARTPESKTCNPFPLYCLDVKNGLHAEDVASAWGGKVDPAAVGLCKATPEDAEANELVQV